ncbi:MAG: tetratricopeptide repeat protein [Ignavibacteriales bacterium]|nr:tetratricopeptide repeat protein [Ignavibacteriales bacterium]
MPNKSILKIGFYLWIIQIFSGCTFYENVTGYFNTYYNAKRNFNEAISEIEKNPQKSRDTNYFAIYTIPKSASDKLDKVIEKCSKVIQLYPKSSYVEDAILMIGQSYVYKGESESAIRKFKELLDNFPGSSLALEAKMLLAISEYQTKHEDEALRNAKETNEEAEKAGEEDLMLKASMLQGQIYIEREDYESAILVLDKASMTSGDDDLLADIEFMRGISYERLGNQLKAAEAFAGVKKHGSTFSKEFQSQFKQGNMLAREKKYDEALEVFNNMLGDALKPDERGLVELGIATTYNLQGDTSTAFPMFEKIDTTYKRTDASAKSYYTQGLTFEKDYSDYGRAKWFYEKAKSEFSSSEITPIATKKYLSLSNYFKLSSNLTRYDSILQVKAILDTQTVAADSLGGKDSLHHFASEVITDSLQKNIDEAIETKQDIVDNSDIESYDNLEADLEPLSEEQSLQAARYARREIGGNRARLNQNRSYTDLENQDEASDSGKNGLTTKINSKPAGPDPLLKVPVDSLQKLIGQVKFELGAHFYLEMDLPDSAVHYYWDVVDNYEDSKFAPRACYALTEIYREYGDKSMEDTVKNILLTKYEGSEYTAIIKKSLGQQVEIATDPLDSTFTYGYRMAEEGKIDSALKIFDSIVLKDSLSPFAPKALFTMGWLLESRLQNDSAFYWYQILIKNYPASIYAAEAKPKVSIKEDPKSVDKFIKIKEIPKVAKTDSPKRDMSKTGDKNKTEQQLEKLPPGDLPEEDEPTDEEPEEEPPADEDDGGGY